MNRPYRGGGGLITRLLGRLEVLHGRGIMEFRLRSDHEIQKRGARTILRIEGLPEIPRFEDGTIVTIRLTDIRDLVVEAKVVNFDKERDEDSDRRERSKGVA